MPEPLPSYGDLPVVKEGSARIVGSPVGDQDELGCLNLQTSCGMVASACIDSKSLSRCSVRRSKQAGHGGGFDPNRRKRAATLNRLGAHPEAPSRGSKRRPAAARPARAGWGNVWPRPTPDPKGRALEAVPACPRLHRQASLTVHGAAAAPQRGETTQSRPLTVQRTTLHDHKVQVSEGAPSSSTHIYLV
jgi:hypothetical protein